jgi:hypothetical protein
MNYEQYTFLLIFLVVNLALTAKAYFECKYKQNAFKDTPFLLLLGSFVWADQVVFGVFWSGLAIFSLYTSNWLTFLLSTSLFWLTRSVGETIYWFNQQFSTIQRNPPEKYFLFTVFHNDSVWFVYQIFWQCMTVIFMLTSLYLAKIWLATI